LHPEPAAGRAFNAAVVRWRPAFAAAPWCCASPFDYGKDPARSTWLSGGCGAAPCGWRACGACRCSAPSGALIERRLGAPRRLFGAPCEWRPVWRPAPRRFAPGAGGSTVRPAARGWYSDT